MADIEKLCDNLKNNGYKTIFCADSAEAADYICSSLIGSTIGIGGSKTVEQLDIFDRLSESNEVAWHWKQTPTEARSRAQSADIYICSANAVSETGEIVNIDGTGNRLAASIYGKKKVIFVIGVNKITPDLESAIYRARNIAAPLNARRFKLSTPCALSSKEMRCYDCNNPQRICRGLLVLMKKINGVEECEVVIVNENLGN